jgi:hypothetical protein
MIFVPPEHVSIDHTTEMTEDDERLAQVVFPPSGGRNQPPLSGAAPPKEAVVSPADPKGGDGSMSLLSLHLISRWVLIVTVITAGVVAILYTHKPFLGGGRSSPLNTAAMYAILVLVLFTLA